MSGNPYLQKAWLHDAELASVRTQHRIGTRSRSSLRNRLLRSQYPSLFCRTWLLCSKVINRSEKRKRKEKKKRIDRGVGEWYKKEKKKIKFSSQAPEHRIYRVCVYGKERTKTSMTLKEEQSRDWEKAQGLDSLDAYNVYCAVRALCPAFRVRQIVESLAGQKGRKTDYATAYDDDEHDGDEDDERKNGRRECAWPICVCARVARLCYPR